MKLNDPYILPYPFGLIVTEGYASPLRTIGIVPSSVRVDRRFYIRLPSVSAAVYCTGKERNRDGAGRSGLEW